MMIRFKKLNKEVSVIYEQMLIQAEQLKCQIDEIQTCLQKFPEGNLICARNGNHYKWYQTNDTGRIYIPKIQKKLAEQLAVKKYYTLKLEDLQAEYRAVQSYLMNHKEEKSEKLLRSPGYRDLLNTHFRPQTEDLFEWMNEPYEYNSSYPEQLIHQCSSGILVRSKSESLIVMSLHTNQIPFRYECALTLGETKVYPDFTIRHPKTGKVYYWEHFGMMDQSTYAKNAGAKLQRYISCGIIPSIQLITTYETKEHPLTSYEVDNIVKQYFL